MPDTMFDTATLTRAVQLASRAPSLHNTQPWRLVAEGDCLHLHLDPHRVVTATDRSAREAVISCGVLLDHLRVAMAAAGWTTIVDRFPNPNDLDHLATLQFSPMAFVTEAHRRRADAILARRTDRLPMTAYADWDAFEVLLRARLAEGPVHLDVLAEDMRSTVAEAAELTESLRLYDSGYHAELAWWTTPFATEDGIPQSSWSRPPKVSASGWRARSRSPRTATGVPPSATIRRRWWCCPPTGTAGRTRSTRVRRFRRCCWNAPSQD